MSLTQSQIYPRNWKVIVATLTMMVAGIIHLLIISHHWEHAPAHGLAMAVFGLLEVIWAILFWLKPSRLLAQAGVILAASLIALWAITRIVPAPFTNEPEEVDFSGVLTIILEGFSAVGLLAMLVNPTPGTGIGRAGRTTIFTFLLISVLLAAGFYQVARAAQPFLPQLNPSVMEHMGDHE